MPTLRFTAQLQITTAECPVTARNLSRKTAIAAILKAKGTQRNLKFSSTWREKAFEKSVTVT